MPQTITDLNRLQKEYLKRFLFQPIKVYPVTKNRICIKVPPFKTHLPSMQSCKLQTVTNSLSALEIKIWNYILYGKHHNFVLGSQISVHTLQLPKQFYFTFQNFIPAEIYNYLPSDACLLSPTVQSIYSTHVTTYLPPQRFVSLFPTSAICNLYKVANST